MVNKPTPDDLKNTLSEMQFYVTQKHGTEPPFTGRLLHNKRDGIYHCLVCDAPLFHSQSKFDSGCGWPSFLSRSATRPFVISTITRTACNVLKSGVEIVMRTWGMFSQMAHSQPANVFASIPPR